ncbi:uncharacterized protein LOC126979114 [Leptidea sinapis]|uniref:uncharacterized protein LOC126979114 n=1 Tax=Leptidea sinapis TaxID=189913 RepID=UPI0021C43D89|nr:uncharacterized protein LOC126979114 [Leptidea sinapis]
MLRLSCVLSLFTVLLYVNTFHFVQCRFSLLGDGLNEIVNGIDEFNNNNVTIFEELKKINPLLKLKSFDSDITSRNITKLIKKYGYTVEEYEVTTEDGYILKIFRIPGNGPVIFLQHGLFESSDDWVSPGKKSIALRLAAASYDVWLGNARGNRHSMKNINLKPNQREFWNFSWHEIGIYDTPAMIDRVLEVTGTTSLVYVGHSQGTTSFYVMGSLKPEYNKKISLMVSLSALAWLSHITTPIRLTAPFANKLYPTLEAIGIYKIFTNDALLAGVEGALCGNTVTALIVCETLVSILGGFNYNQVDLLQLPAIFSYYPSGASIKQFVHYTQLVESGYFRQFDYGTKNEEIYQSPSPPSYPVENITAPVAIFFGKGDFLGVKEDVDILVSKLPNVVDFYTVPNPKFDHFDFIWAKNRDTLVLPKLIQLIEKYKKVSLNTTPKYNHIQSAYWIIVERQIAKTQDTERKKVNEVDCVVGKYLEIWSVYFHSILPSTSKKYHFANSGGDFAVCRKGDAKFFGSSKQLIVDCDCSLKMRAYIYLGIIFIWLRNYLVSGFYSLDDFIKQDHKVIVKYLDEFRNVTQLPKDISISAAEARLKAAEFQLGLMNEDIHLNITQLVSKYGYPVEEHYVETIDGYVLKVFRIPSNGRPLFLMHGFLCSADDWVSPGVESGIAYLLASKGFDVWMGNARGNKHSKFNIRKQPIQPSFWDFSWHEIGMIDVPTMIDYVLEKTQREKLTYIGHSQGTTSFFVMCSLKPEYNDKIELMVALSAVAWMSHLVSPISRVYMNFAPVFNILPNAATNFEISGDTTVSKIFRSTLCGDGLLAFTVCENIMSVICGFDYSQINFRQLPVIFNHCPAGSSMKQALHYSQEVSSGYFRQFDYGLIRNLIKYGSPQPPSYPVEKVTAAVAIVYSEGDWLASVTDVNKLRSKLPNVIDFYKIPLKKFNHQDYLWAKDTKTLIFPKLMELITKYNNVSQVNNRTWNEQ